MTALAAPVRPPTTGRAAYVEQVMGLPVSLHLRGPAPRGPEAVDAVQQVFARLRRADELFSTYRPTSEVSRVGAGTLALADVHPLVREVNDLAVIARARTGGLFDVRLPVPGGSTYDPSGLVKGWAVERAAAVLDELPDHDFCLNAGGDVLVRSAPGSRPWRIGVEDPRQPTALLTSVERSAGAVATSGTRARGEHLVDPRDGSRPGHLLSVTVTGPSLMWADVLATAAFIRGVDAPDWVRTNLGYEALVVLRTGEIRRSAGFGALTPPRGAGRS